MTSSNTPPLPDLFSLAEASMETLVTTLEDARTIGDDGGPVPPRAVQIADLIAAEAVRLIRLGTPDELADAAFELARCMGGEMAAVLEERQPDAFRLVSGAATTLDVAAEPSSSGGEVAVLRSWNGKAREAVAVITFGGRSMPRAELRRRLGDLKESHMSHMLADLEAAGLITRVREGREIVVRLGPLAESEHVREMLPPRPEVPFGSERFEKAELNRFTWLGGEWGVPHPNWEPGTVLTDRWPFEISDFRWSRLQEDTVGAKDVDAVMRSRSIGRSSVFAVLSAKREPAAR